MVKEPATGMGERQPKACSLEEISRVIVDLVIGGGKFVRSGPLEAAGCHSSVT